LIASTSSDRDARLQPKFEFVKQIIDAGILGEINYIHQVDHMRQGRLGYRISPRSQMVFKQRNIARRSYVRSGSLRPLVSSGSFI
jgi:hypothetical protein